MRCLRATKDKLPRGLYTVSVALYSRLGGSVLDCSSKKQEGMVHTEPVEHRGRFFDSDLHVNQRLFMVRMFMSVIQFTISILQRSIISIVHLYVYIICLHVRICIYEIFTVAFLLIHDTDTDTSWYELIMFYLNEKKK